MHARFTASIVELRPLSRLARAALLAGFAVLAPLPALSQSSDDPVVGKVNGVEIRASDIKLAEEDVGANMPPMTDDAKRDYLVSYVADMMLLAKAGEGNKLDQSADFRTKMQYFRNKILMDAMLGAEGKASLTPEAVKKVYDEAVKGLAGQKEVRARHILVETEAEAKAILADVKAGKDFAALAKEKSKDPGSGQEGGDLGYFSKGQMVPEFEETAFKLTAGQVSDPVKSQFGFHIIKVEDIRDRKVPPLDQVRDQIESFVQRKAQADLVTKLRAAAKIEKIEAKKPDEPKADAPKAEPAPAKKN